MRWYVMHEGKTVGPVEGEDVFKAGQGGGLRPGMHVREEDGQWVPIESSPFGALVAPPAHTAATTQPTPSAVVAQLAAIMKLPQWETWRGPGILVGGLVLLAIVGKCGVDAWASSAAKTSNAAGEYSQHRRAETLAARATASVDEEALATAKVIRQVWPVLDVASKVSWGLATCIDELKSFDALSVCAEDALGRTKAAQKALAALLEPSATCAKELQAAGRAYLDSEVAYQAAFLTWLSGKQTLKAAMNGRRLADACHSTKCDGRPYDLDFGPGFSAVSGVACTESLFRCGAADNVCKISKVADRLGVGEKGPAGSGPLTVRATGTLIR